MKKASAAARDVKERVENAQLPHAVTNEGLPDLLQSNLLNVLKLPKEPVYEQESIIQVKEDGSALNTLTGELIKPVERLIISEISNNSEIEELERRRKEKEDKRFADWKARTNGANHSGGHLSDSDTTPNTTIRS